MNSFNDNGYKAARHPYVEEAKEKWGSTVAYAECAEKTAAYTDEKWDTVIAGLMEIFAVFADCMKAGESAGSEAAQKVVKKLQEYITTHFYVCTNEILAGLGLMYVEDERFRMNIDRYGESTAVFAGQAIQCYCQC